VRVYCINDQCCDLLYQGSVLFIMDMMQWEFAHLREIMSHVASVSSMWILRVMAVKAAVTPFLYQRRSPFW
jgi:hypothetical protein